MTTRRADVFVSYRHREPTMAWVRTELVPAIEDAGYRVIIDHRDFDQDAGITTEMEAAARARVTLAVVDEAYEASGFTLFEQVTAARLVVVVRPGADATRVPVSSHAVDLRDGGGVADVVAALDDVLKRIFVVEGRSDAEWVEGWLLPALDEAGVSVGHLGDLPGWDLPVELAARLRHADRVVVVLSGAYFREVSDRTDELIFDSTVYQRHPERLLPVRRDLVIAPQRYPADGIIPALDSGQWERALATICASIGVPTPSRQPPPDCPYPGLLPYDERAAPRFFGRDAEITEALAALRQSRFVALIGPSGSGKSSLAFAGVVPRVRAGSVAMLQGAAVAPLRPGPDASTALAELVARWREDGAGAPLLVVVDQLEGAFGATGGPALLGSLQQLVASEPRANVLVTVRADFYPQLMESPLWPLVAANRVEVVPLSGAALREAIRRPAKEVGVVIEEALVERLAAQAEGEPGLLPFLQETLVDLWSHVEWQLLTLDAYAELSSDEDRDPGLFRAIRRAADQALATLEAERPGSTGVVRAILVRLVNVGVQPPTRRRVPASALVGAAPDEATFDRCIEELDARRIVTRDVEGGVPVVDLSHEAVIRGWAKLGRWVGELQEAETTRRALADRADAWSREEAAAGDGTDVGLLEGRPLDAATAWIESDAARDVGVDDHIRRYVRRSGDRERRRRRRRRALVGGAFVALVVVAATLASLAVTARRAQRDAEAESAQRVSSQLRAAAAEYAGGDRLPVQALLVRAADRIAPTPLTLMEMLTTAEQDPPIVRQIESPTRNVGFDALWVDDEYLAAGDGVGGLYVTPVQDGAPLPFSRPSVELGHGIFAIVRLPGTDLIAVGGGRAATEDAAAVGTDGWVDLVRLSDPTAPPRRLALGSDSLVSALAVTTSDLVVGRWDGSVSVVDVTDLAAPRSVRELAIPSSGDSGQCAQPDDDRKVRSLVVAGGDRWLAAGANNCVIAAWDLTGAGPPRILTGHADKVRALAVVPGSTRVLSTGDDRSVREWDLEATAPGGDVLVAAADVNRVAALCVAPDGSAVVTAGRDHRVRRWTVGVGFLSADPQSYDAHDTFVRAVACLGPRRFVSLALDSVVLWDLDRTTRGAVVGSLPAGATARMVAVRPGAVAETATAYTTGDGGGVTVQPAAGGAGRDVALTGLVPVAVAYSADGATLAVAGDVPGAATQSEVRLFDAATLDEEVRRPLDDGPVTSLTMLDVDHVAVGTRRGIVERWTRGVPATATTAAGLAIRALTYAGDGSLVAGDAGGTLRCIAPDVAGPLPDGGSIELGRAVTALATGADGTVVAGTGEGLLVIFRDAVDGSSTSGCDPSSWPRVDLPPLHDDIRSVALAADGTLLLAANSDGAVDVWDVHRSRRIGSLTLGSGERAELVAADPGGTVIAAGGGPRVVTFSADRTVLRDRLCGIAGRELTADEVRTFLPDVRFRSAASCAGDSD